jgi:Asp-tRNA(Asn)/Glu-tRNA(Gln) amidotransferase A subunit family amidase
MTETSQGRIIAPPPSALSGPHTSAVAMTLVEQAAAIRAGQLSCRELTAMYLDRIDSLDASGEINAYITVRGDQVLAEAAALDATSREGPTPPLFGVPLALKDNISTAGTLTTAGTAPLDHYVPTADATVARRLKDAGAVVLGKTNLHELCYGITSNNPRFGPVRNPYDPSRIPGGSSGGSGAAVAAHLSSAAIGSDTAGSVRIPAALCGAVGIKPTLGRVSRGGLIGLAWTFDIVGPIARTVDDAAALLAVMTSGADPRDPGALDAPSGSALDERADRSADSLRGLRVGIPGGYFAHDNAPDIDRAVVQVHRVLEAAGAILVPVDIRGLEDTVSLGLFTAAPEAVVSVEDALHAAGVDGDLASHLGEFGQDVRAALGAQVGPEARPTLGYDYARALNTSLPALRRAVDAALADVDVLLTPTTPAAAVPIAQDVEMEHNGRMLSTLEVFIRYTFFVSMTGLPAITVPAGLDSSGLPIAVQLVGPRWSEPRLIEVARGYERATA